MAYTVELWGSHPSLDNDDCITGDDAGTLAAAHEVLSSLTEHRRFRSQWSYAAIKGPDGKVVHEVKTNPNRVIEADDDSADRSEFAMQQGMAHGIDAYNEARGYETDDHEQPSGYRR